MIKQLLRDSLLYLVPNLLARGIGLILLPIYTRYLSPADYGVVELLAILYALLNLVLPLEISQAVARFSPDASVRAAKSVLVSTAFWFTFIGFAAWFALTVAFPVELARIILGVDGDPFLLPTAAAAMLVNALLYLAMNQLRWNLQQNSYVAVSLLFAIVTAIVSVTLIVGFRFGVYGMILGQFAGSIVALAVATLCLWPTSPILLQFSKPELQSLLGFSAPLVISSAAVYVTLYTDRWLVSVWVGLDGVGMYSVALRVASILTLVTGSVQLALTPLIYSQHRDPTTPSAIRSFFQYYLFGAFSLILVIGVFSEDIIELLAGPQFFRAREVLVPVMLATLFMSFNVFSPGLALAKRTGRTAATNILGAAVNITVTLWLIPRLGLMGAAIGSVIGSSLIMMIRFAWSQKYYSIPYRWNRYAVSFIVLGLVLGFGTVYSLPIYGRAALALGGITVFALLLVRRADHAAAISRGQGA